MQTPGTSKFFQWTFWLASQANEVFNSSKHILRAPQQGLLTFLVIIIMYRTSQQQHQRLPTGKNCSFNFFVQLLLHCAVFAPPDLCHKFGKYPKNHQITWERLTSFLSCFGCHLHWLVESRCTLSSLRLPELAKTFLSPRNHFSHHYKIWTIMNMLKSNEMAYHIWVKFLYFCLEFCQSRIRIGRDLPCCIVLPLLCHGKQLIKYIHTKTKYI